MIREDEDDSDNSDTESQEAFEDEDSGENTANPSDVASPSEFPYAQAIGDATKDEWIPDQEENLQSLQSHVLHPQPTRSYRPAVTSAYETAPLPLYENGMPAHLPPEYMYPQPAPWHQSQGDHPMMYQHHHLAAIQPDALPDLSSEKDATSKTLGGYRLIASKLSGPNKAGKKLDGPPPLYRKFEELNHRILLHLQDEIAELEEDLHVLDQHIARLMPPPPDKKPMPASRRAEARIGGELHYRRTELLGRIFIKLGQYSK
jgi:hypothetical protein